MSIIDSGGDTLVGSCAFENFLSIIDLFRDEAEFWA